MNNLNLPMPPTTPQMVEKVVPLHAYQSGHLPKGQIVLGDHCDETETRIVRVFLREAA